MNVYEVLISEKANDDMEAIYTYIAEVLLAPVAAANQYDRIAEAILSLDVMPNRINLWIQSQNAPKGLEQCM